MRFLREDGVETTNNRAERDLRPAVIAREGSADFTLKVVV
jgi:hypothetical protein